MAPLKYYVSVRTRLLVEPATGAIVSLDKIDQTLSAAPDLKASSGSRTYYPSPRWPGSPPSSA